MLLVPVLVLLAVQDAAELFLPEWLEGDYALVVFVPPLVVLLGLFPVLLRHVWRTRPLEPGRLRTRLEAAAARHGFRARDILVWQTGSMVVNAAVAGFAAPAPLRFSERRAAGVAGRGRRSRRFSGTSWGTCGTATCCCASRRCSCR